MRFGSIIFGLGLLLVVAGVSIVFYKTPASNQGQQASVLPKADFGGVSLTIELATSSEARMRGLSGRKVIPGDYGMLFVFEKEGVYGFWMKDTLASLDFFWLDAQGQVVSVTENVDPSSYPRVFYPPRPVRYVLETTAGFAHAHNVATGTQLRLQNVEGVLE